MIENDSQRHQQKTNGHKMLSILYRFLLFSESDDRDSLELLAQRAQTELIDIEVPLDPVTGVSYFQNILIYKTHQSWQQFWCW